MTRAQRRIRARKMAAVAPFGLTWQAPAAMTDNPNRGKRNATPATARFHGFTRDELRRIAAGTI